MKTLMLFNDLVDGEAYFIDLDGDYRYLDETYLGSGNEKESKELLKIWSDTRKYKVLAQPTKDWDFFIRCGSC